ncbi:spermatogenesis-associated protein 16 isoform X1 [Pantherophis guttatus]|uniref:Spermatogenesis-associated protein 16 n=1 Tax=Pantherophis guttatus TaxID=94885 RepID=A0A6P9DGP2_PANGU|nr:spermatogenesis-associated protein 16 isoform X1 [Pantherophis guttatus]
MESANNTHFENITKEASRKEYVIQQLRIAAQHQNDSLEALQVIKFPLGAEMAENAMEKLKTGSNAAKEKQCNDLERLTLKRKMEGDEKTVMRKEPRLLEQENLVSTVLLSHIPLKSLVEVEMKLIYTDEENVSYEFLETQSPSCVQPKSLEVGGPDSQGTINVSLQPQMDKWLQVSLKDASTCYRQKKYAMAAGQFRTALELCSKGAALGKPFEASPRDISSIASFIETKLVICYLKMRKPDLALNHSHRSVILNPAYFRNHLRQAAVFRCLERYSEAARSTMIADYTYWLSGGRDQHTSKLIKLYWQAMIEEAITRAEYFSVMYTPFAIKIKVENTDKLKEVFIKKHPDYVEYIYTDPHGLHSLPQTADWSCPSPQSYLLTLGLKNKEVGKFLEKMSCRKLPTFSEHKAPFSPITKDEAERHLETIGKRILPIMDFIRGTKLTESFCACSGVIEKLQYASLLGRLQRIKEQSQVINQAMAELATIPYLQDISQPDAELLQSLMADAMDTLEGRKSDKERVWNKIQKVGIIEDFLYQLEDSFLKTKKLRTARRQKMKMKRLQSEQPC